MQSIDQLHRNKKKVIQDLTSWLQAFTVYMAALSSCEKTSKEEVCGLLAYSHVIQLSKDLRGPQWLKYDKEYRLWAAAKGVRVWGELNFSIYGRCLAANASSGASVTQGMEGGSHKRGPPEKRGRSRGSCFKWNFEGACTRRDCIFDHQCYHCSSNRHQASDCPKRPKQSS